MTSNSRERIDDRRTNYPFCTQNWDNYGNLSGGCWEVDNMLGTYRTMQDVSVPRYHERVAAGELFFNDFVATKQYREASGTIARYTAEGNPQDSVHESSNGCFFIHSAWPYGPVEHMAIPIDVSQLRTLASTEAYAGIQDPDFQGLVFVAELRETIAMFRRPIEVYRRILVQAKRHQRRVRRNPRARARARKNAKLAGSSIDPAAASVSLLDFITSQWLQYRYGIMPLVYDAQDVVTALDNLKKKPPERKTSRGYELLAEEDTETVSIAVNPWNLTKEVRTRREVQIRAGVMYTFDTSSSWGMEMQQIPIAAYEVIPFSFVADWFMNIGTFIEAITPKIGVSVLGSWIVESDFYHTTAEGTSVFEGAMPPYVSHVDPTASEVFQTHSKKRNCGNPEIGLATRPIPFSGDLGVKRIADSLALIWQLLLSR